MPKVLTVTQASRTYGAHIVTLTRLCLMGRLEARKNADGRWLISKKSLEQWQRNRQRVCRMPEQEDGSAAATA